MYSFSVSACQQLGTAWQFCLWSYKAKCNVSARAAISFEAWVSRQSSFRSLAEIQLLGIIGLMSPVSCCLLTGGHSQPLTSSSCCFESLTSSLSDLYNEMQKAQVINYSDHPDILPFLTVSHSMT